MMTEPVLVRELEAIRDTMQDGFRGVHDRLDVLNGRVRAAEATQQVLTDRSERNEHNIEALGANLTHLQTKGCAVGAILHGGAAPEAGWWTPKRTAGVTMGGTGLLVAAFEFGKAFLERLWK